MRRRLVALVLAAVSVLAGTSAVAAERDDAAGDDEVAAATPSPATPVLSARRTPGLLAAPAADRRLTAAVDALLARQGGTSCLTVSSAGRAIVARNAGEPLVPASLTKLVTAVAALEVLGPEHRFRTTVLAAGPDLHLVGGGDPLLGTASYAARFENQPQLRTPLEDLADAVVAAGVTSVEGRIVGDDGRYDADRYPDPWPARFVTQDQSGPLSALSVNDAWAAFPPNPDTRVPDEAPAPDPPAHAAAVLGLLLGERGVTVAGGFASGPVPAGAVEVAALESAPLEEIVGQMLAESDNQTSELLLKELAVARGRPGTTADGVAVAVEAVSALGVPFEGAALVDGSGLGAGNRTTCALVQTILDGADLADDLAVAGETGTLSRRFVDSTVTGRLRAKTGTLNQVTALAGYLATTRGADVVFTYIVNLPAGSVVGEGELALQDELAATLAAYPEGPSLDELGPR